MHTMLEANNWHGFDGPCLLGFITLRKFKLNLNGVGHATQVLLFIFINLSRKTNFFQVQLPALILIVLLSLKS